MQRKTNRLLLLLISMALAACSTQLLPERCNLTDNQQKSTASTPPIDYEPTKPNGVLSARSYCRV